MLDWIKGDGMPPINNIRNKEGGMRVQYAVNEQQDAIRWDRMGSVLQRMNE